METPFFSIIIPTFRRPALLQTCIHSLEALNYPKERYEIIVVDDDDGSGTSEIPTACDVQIRIIRQKNSGPAAARNRGAAIAQGKFLAFTDDDCTVDCEWLSQLEKTFQRYPSCAAGGRTVNTLDRNPYSVTSQLILDVVYEHYNVDAESARFFASNNFACPADLFRKMGGFDETFRTSEDREFCDRWNRSGLRLVSTTEAVILHSHSLGLRNLWRQHFSYGEGAFHFHSVRKQLGLRGLQIDSRFYRTLFTSPFRDSRVSCWKLSFLMLTAQFANAFGYFSAKLSRSPEWETKVQGELTRSQNIL